MIKTISDLLLKIISAEKSKIDLLKIPHRVTIGNMYEGLTKDILDRALFEGLNLNVVTNSFIINHQGDRSKEMDIVLIQGEGKKLPHTNQYDVDIKQVIIVIQVKKKLNKKSLVEGYNNLQNVTNIMDSTSYQEYHKKMFFDSYKEICNESILDNGKLRTHFDSSTKEAIFNILKEEVLIPPRILFGYEGYKSEKSLRDGFVNFLSENLSTVDMQIHGFSPLHFPNLIVNGNVSIIKNNGMPFIGPLTNQSWPFYCTNKVNPINNLLEIIWTRMSYMFNLNPEIFGEDLIIDGANIFLSGNIVNVDGIVGWNFHYEPSTKKQLDFECDNEEWSPTKVSMGQHHIIAYLCRNEKILITKINDELSKIGKTVSIDDFTTSILATKLVFLDGYKYLRLSTEQCKCFISKDGYFAADDKSGKLTKWVSKYYGDKTLDLRKKQQSSAANNVCEK